MNIFAAALCAEDGQARLEAKSLASRFAAAGRANPLIWIGDGCALLVAPVTASGAAPDIALTERFAAVGDMRFDDLAALAAKLSLPPSATPAELVLAAYARWAESCCDHLTGVFAFAVYDRRERRLFAARDRFGVRPLYLREDGRTFRMATAAHLLSSERIDESFVAGFLTGLVEDETGTVDPTVTRLPPARALTKVAFSSSVIHRYWSLQATPPPPPREVVEAFRERFSRAVARQAGEPERTAVLLSGGIDSTSIALVAARQRSGATERLRSFSLVFPGEEDVDESRYIDLVAKAAGLHETRVSGPDAAPLHGFEGEASACAFADGPGTGRLRTLFEAAGELKIEALLDGHGGDEVVWTGYRRIVDLAQSGRWFRAMAQVPGLSAVSGEAPLLIAAATVEAAAPGGRAGRFFSRLARSYRWRFSPRTPALAGSDLSLLSDAFRRRTGLDERVAAARSSEAVASDRQAHEQALLSPRTPFAFESLRRLSEPAGIDLRFPFFDVELVSFCLGLPSEEKLRAGWPRSVLRRAMAGDMPPAVRWRRDKTNFGPSLARGLAHSHEPMIRRMIAERDGALSACYDMDRLRELLERLLGEPGRVSTPEAVAAWRAAYFHMALSGAADRGEDFRAA